MNVVSVDKAGRLIIPAEMRKKLGITDQTKLFIMDIDNKIIIEKLDRAEIARRLQHELEGVDIDAMVAQVEDEMNERSRKYKKEVALGQ
jgi:AbrB family looped-hinge helix DNA binding protein